MQTGKMIVLNEGEPFTIEKGEIYRFRNDLFIPNENKISSHIFGSLIWVGKIFKKKRKKGYTLNAGRE